MSGPIQDESDKNPHQKGAECQTQHLLSTRLSAHHFRHTRADQKADNMRGGQEPAHLANTPGDSELDSHLTENHDSDNRERGQRGNMRGHVFTRSGRVRAGCTRLHSGHDPLR